ncbi:e3 ubiquitin-protein ligase [Stylonychia lemnae]|uniref:E3 ubiquitin-protein ligase n=1 Tax=Stylonychia lemnae TaxID=5949 RepID=A0A078AR17_STYLE|nr:e3 ubiquitin-protein ligase [Stylonychia lemnae]|eukprot:CDW84391.1 e3 ubiquitin-protein ligase [Stylonychia lemnae]
MLRLETHNDQTCLRGVIEEVEMTGHNCKITIVNNVGTMNIFSHNNSISGQYSITELEGRSGMTIIKNMIIQGHNNVIKNLQIKNLTVKGCNNFLKNLKVDNVVNRGVNNQYPGCITYKNQPFQEIQGMNPNQNVFSNFMPTFNFDFRGAPQNWTANQNQNIHQRKEEVDPDAQIRNQQNQFMQQQQRQKAQNQSNQNQQDYAEVNRQEQIKRLQQEEVKRQQREELKSQDRNMSNVRNKEILIGRMKLIMMEVYIPKIKIQIIRIKTRILVIKDLLAKKNNREMYKQLGGVLSNFGHQNPIQSFTAKTMSNFSNAPGTFNTININILNNPTVNFRSGGGNYNFASEFYNNTSSDSDSDEYEGIEQQEEDEDMVDENDANNNGNNDDDQEYDEEGDDEGLEYEPGEYEDEEPKYTEQQIQQTINSFTDFVFDNTGKDADNCAICYDLLKKGQMVKGLPCMHIFHSKCINQWLKQKLQCPLCKVEIVP